MTQLLLFEAPQSSISFSRAAPPNVVAEPSSQPELQGYEHTAPLPQLERSLPLYDPQRGEIHHLGDLAQRVLSRYEIVAKRREILLARGPREAARA